MHRVELKDCIMFWVLSKVKTFLMHRVELKESKYYIFEASGRGS